MTVLVVTEKASFMTTLTFAETLVTIEEAIRFDSLALLPVTTGAPGVAQEVAVRPKDVTHIIHTEEE